MTKLILYSIGMNETHLLYELYHLKKNLKKSILCKWKMLKPTIELMFRASSQGIMEILLKKARNDCSGNTNCVSTLVKLMDNKYFWAAYKKKTCRFFSIIYHIGIGCPTKINIGQLIKGGDCIVLLKDKFPFRPIKMMRLVKFTVNKLSVRN